MMNDYWHIPRASLASSSSAASSSAASLASSSNRSNRSIDSNPPTIHRGVNASKVAKQFTSIDMESSHQQLNKNHKNNSKLNPPRLQQQQKVNNQNETMTTTTKEAITAASSNEIPSKRGSRSSQGSSDSNNSTRSTASGSLLLTAANLERFAEIHKNQEKQNKMLTKNYLNEGLTMVHQNGSNYTNNISSSSSNNHNNNNNNKDDVNADAAIIQIDPNLDFVKTKDLDSVSIASSMHFTMVNGESGASKKQKRGLCDRGRQVTVLIISMSTIFLLLIMGMVYALEMRAREMPQS